VFAAPYARSRWVFAFCVAFIAAWENAGMMWLRVLTTQNQEPFSFKGVRYMSFFDNLKKGFNEAKQNLTTEISKFRSKDLLQAIVAGSTMIAYADGEASPSEKEKLMGYIKNSEQLKVFDPETVIESFNQYLSRFEFDATIAAGEALQKITVFKGKPEAHLIIRVCQSIAMADGQCQEPERRALEQICTALELDLKNFL
jgi:tellurite resistance protein TerB